MRTNDGKLAILDFGLMTEVTDNQKYGMIEAIAHLLNRDYTEIGQDFINLDFIPEGTDTRPIVPALTKVFDAALAGGGAKSINFQELAADLAEITFEYVSHLLPVDVVRCLSCPANCLDTPCVCAPLLAFSLSGSLHTLP